MIFVETSRRAESGPAAYMPGTEMDPIKFPPDISSSKKRFGTTSPTPFVVVADAAAPVANVFTRITNVFTFMA